MQHPFSRAVPVKTLVLAAVIVCFASPTSAASGPKGHSAHVAKHSFGHKNHHGRVYYATTHSAGASSGSHGPDTPRLRVPISNQSAPNAVTLPFNPSKLPPRLTLGIADEAYPHSYQSASQPLPQRRRLEMLSGNPVDPNTILSELPSGRIVMQAPFYAHRSRAHYYHSHRGAASVQPYARPTFHIIGEPSRKHMGQPVKLTYGTEPRKRLNPSPRVVWIKAERQGRQIHVIK